jgi:hypothetical protein
MGFKDAKDVLAQLERRCLAKAFYNLSKGDVLPDGLRFEVALTDLSSLLVQLFYGADCGSTVLKRLQFFIDRDIETYGARVHVFCVDSRIYVTAAKLRERRLREAHRDTQKSLDSVSLLLLHNGSKTTAANYAFGLDASMPADFQNVMCTPQLMRKAIEFLLLLLAEHVTLAHKLEQGRIIVSGLQNAGENVLHRIFVEGQCATKKETCTVGEAEGQCMYWMLQLKAHASRFLVHSNDSDALALALMHTRHFYSAESQQLGGALWVDITAVKSNVRFVDAFALWRGLKSTNLHDGRFIRNDVELLLLVATLAGNDYCLRMPRIGVATLFSHIDAGLLQPVAKRKRYPLRIDVVTGDMVVDELALVCFLAFVFQKNETLRQDALRIGAIVEKDKDVWDYSETDLHRFFDVMAKSADVDVKTTQPKLPYYNTVRAHVRRAFFSLHYYFNVAHPERLLDSHLQISGHSVYGHVDLPLRDSVADDATDGLAGEVLLRCQETGQALQPFDSGLRAVQFASPYAQKRPEETVMAQRVRQMRKSGPTPLWTDLPLRSSLGLTFPFEGEHGSNFLK